MTILTTGDRRQDRQLFIVSNPPLQTLLLTLADIGLYATTRGGLDLDGQASTVRIVQALLVATTDLAPAVALPVSFGVAYGRIRGAIASTLVAIAAGPTMGTWRPLLTAAAGDAMARILATDATRDTPVGRVADLTLLLAGITWEQST